MVCINIVLFVFLSIRLHDDADEVMKRLSSTFSAETNKRDDEERMSVQLEKYLSPHADPSQAEIY